MKSGLDVVSLGLRRGQAAASSGCAPPASPRRGSVLVLTRISARLTLSGPRILLVRFKVALGLAGRELNPLATSWRITSW